MGDFPFVAVGGFVVVAIAVIILGYYASKKRREAMAAFAAEQGLSFAADPPDGLIAAYRDFDPFGRGGGRQAFNLVHGRRGEVQWEIFDYRFSTGSGKNRRTHTYGIVAAKLPLTFPQTSIRPEGLFDKLAGMLGFDDINFESEEFSRRFHVKCEDRRRAYDLIHPELIEFLLSSEPVHWQLAGPAIVLTRQGRYPVTELPRVMGSIEQFISHLPNYLRQELGRRPVR